MTTPALPPPFPCVRVLPVLQVWHALMPVLPCCRRAPPAAPALFLCCARPAHASRGGDMHAHAPRAARARQLRLLPPPCVACAAGLSVFNSCTSHRATRAAPCAPAAPQHLRAAPPSARPPPGGVAAGPQPGCRRLPLPCRPPAGPRARRARLLVVFLYLPTAALGLSLPLPPPHLSCCSCLSPRAGRPLPSCMHAVVHCAALHPHARPPSAQQRRRQRFTPGPAFAGPAPGRGC
jgi:hypothetical protein